MSILLISKIRSLREALLNRLLANGYNQSVVAAGVDGRPWQQVAQPPSVLFISCDATEGVKLVSEFRVDHPSTSIGVLPFSDRDEEFIAWAGSGISGYVEPDTALDGIVGAILRLAEGKIVYPARLSGLLLHRFGRRSGRADPQDGLADLTRRELEVVEMLADGQANKQIARRLTISEATVKNHVHNILEKLHVGSRGQAAARFRRSQFGFAPVKCEMALPALDPAAAFKMGR